MSLDIGSYWGKWDLHVHTQSSYDYQKRNFSDEGLVATWKENGYVAVAITDHFNIDGKRISDLQNLASQEGITVFPGVEFRTDKGDRNVHIIAIFSDKIDAKELGNYFKYNMIEEKAKNAHSNETIYWELKDIQEFTKKYQGILTVHAGNKSNGIDKSLNNDEFFKAIKMEYAQIVDAFEVNNMKSYEGYKKYVVPYLKREVDKEYPVIVCSDNHNYDNYEVSVSLWIKADNSFEGLKQALLHPAERIYLGEKPRKLKDIEQNPGTFMKCIEIKKNKNAKNEETWFDSKIPLNPGLVAVIGNKGSGKSALSDILGHANKVNDTDKFSFLNSKRFNKAPNRYGEDYYLKLEWYDGKLVEHEKLNTNNFFEYSTQTAQYLPQQHIEEVCTNLDKTHFQEEIDKVIFSYINPQDSLGANNLNEYMTLKTEQIDIELKPLIDYLSQVNQKIIQLERKLKADYKKQVGIKLQEIQEALSRHRKLKPVEVLKTENSDQVMELTKIESYNQRIDSIKSEIKSYSEQLITINKQEQKITTLKSRVMIILSSIEEINKEFKDITEELGQVKIVFKIKVEGEIDNFNKLLNYIADKKQLLAEKLKLKEEHNETIEKEKSEILNSINDANKEYQGYIIKLKAWEDKEREIIGDEITVETLKYYEKEADYVENKLEQEYLESINSRKQIIKSIYEKKLEKKRIFQSVYTTIAQKIEEVLGDTNQGIRFNANLLLDKKSIINSLDYINKRARSDFQGAEESEKIIATRIQELNIDSFEAVETFILRMLTCGLENDYDQLEKVITDKERYYNTVSSLEYLEINYLLTYNGNTLEQLSPGERGLLLLIFYLLLNKESNPIIIDQPEDNLDNQSVYSQLVPCMLEAKKRRQVIVVTHNPNIAIACDAEQVIISEINKVDKKITYISGGIENSIINGKIVEILEGTRPAFRLREHKYNV